MSIDLRPLSRVFFVLFVCFVVKRVFERKGGRGQVSGGRKE